MRQAFLVYPNSLFFTEHSISVTWFQLKNLLYRFIEYLGYFQRANTVEGTNLPVSIALMVCRLTPTTSAKCCWVIRSSARSTRILFFISQRLFKFPQFHFKDNQENNNIRKHIKDQDIQKQKLVTKKR